MRKRYLWLLRVVVAMGASLALLTAAGNMWQRAEEREDTARLPPPGQLVEVGGYRLHLSCMGTLRLDRPTIVLDTLAGGASMYWARVQPALAKRQRVCAYDRAGFGWSDDSPAPPTLAASVRDLHTLLLRARVAPPYLLVGHSKGGLIVRGYQRAYADRVAGIVLLELSHPRQYLRFPQLEEDDARQLKLVLLMSLAARIGLLRFYIERGNSFDYGALPPLARAQLSGFWAAPRHWRSVARDMQGAAAFFHEAETLPDLGTLPLTVITASENRAPGWQVLQSDLVGSAQRGHHIVLAGATHGSIVFEPRYAARVAMAIEALAAPTNYARRGPPRSVKLEATYPFGN